MPTTGNPVRASIAGSDYRGPWSLHRPETAGPVVSLVTGWCASGGAAFTCKRVQQVARGLVGGGQCCHRDLRGSESRDVLVHAEAFIQFVTQLGQRVWQSFRAR